jgi:uncharacterized protein involved in exopolysaccharide biosynthesis
MLEILTKQYEIARMDEARDSAIVQVLDKGVRPEQRSFPVRSLVVGLSTIIALFAAVIFVLFEQSLQRAETEDPHYAARLQRLKTSVLLHRRWISKA